MYITNVEPEGARGAPLDTLQNVRTTDNLTIHQNLIQLLHYYGGYVRYILWMHLKTILTKVVC